MALRGGAKADVAPEEPSAVDGVYQISTAANLVWFSDYVNAGNYTAEAVLTADIDMSDVDNFTPIAYSNQAPENAYAYRGTFDGQGHVISNLTITKSENNNKHVGLFGLVYTGTIENLCVRDVTITDNSTTAAATGAIIGRNGSSTIRNCCAVNVRITRATASSGTTTYGAVCGYISNGSTSRMENCYSRNAKGTANEGAEVALKVTEKGTATVLGSFDDNSEEPYGIGSAIGLKWFSVMVNAGNQSIDAVLTKDIDLENEPFTPIGEGVADNTLGRATAYKGNFDGQGHKISNLKIVGEISGKSLLGLFSRVHSTSSSVSNLYLENVNISTEQTTAVSIGGIAGRLDRTTIKNCAVVNITISHPNFVSSDNEQDGGVCGYMVSHAQSNMINCFTNYTTIGKKGGSAIATNCYAGSTTNTGIALIGEKNTTGELCYLLNGSSSESPVWFQTIGTDTYPVLDKTHATVYITALQCDGITPATGADYSNDPNATVIEPHGTFTGGFCDKCGNMQANGDGFYEIESADQLLWFGNYVNKGETESKALLKANIDMAGKGWTAMNEFAGTFDGGNFTISNLDAPFCYSTEGNCVIRNLTLSADADLVYSGTENGFGAFVCQNNKLNAAGSLLIKNCVNNTPVDNQSGKNWTGGFIGGAANGSASVTTTIRNCVNNAAITSANEAVSGFIGSARKGDIVIEDCRNTGAITSPKTPAGFLGQGQTPTSVTMTDCINTGNITATTNAQSRAGGLIGVLYIIPTTTINRCGNEGTIDATHADAGGLVGYMDANAATLTITDSYNKGNVSAESNYGALVGMTMNGNTSMNVTNCWNSGAAASNTFGSTSVTYTNCYDVNASGTGITQMTAEQVASGEVTYKLNGNSSDGIWRQTLGTDMTPNLTADGDKVYPFATSGTTPYFVNNESSPVVPAMTLTDKADYAADANFTAESLTYNRTLEAGGYNSLCLPFEVTKTMLGEGSKLFTLTEVGTDAVTLKEVDEVAAGTPCFASVTSDFTFGTMTGVAMVKAVNNDGNIKGTFTNNDALGAGFYKLSSDGTYFGLTTDGATATAFRSYIEAPTSGSVKTLNILLSDGTSLTPALSEEREAVVYDLAGRRVEKATKGIYIVNGKKVMK